MQAIQVGQAISKKKHHSFAFCSLTVCGDGVCTAETGETCSSCATDCCITFPVGATAGIVVFSLLVPASIVLSILGVRILICYRLQTGRENKHFPAVAKLSPQLSFLCSCQGEVLSTRHHSLSSTWDGIFTKATPPFRDQRTAHPCFQLHGMVPLMPIAISQC